MTSVTDTTFNVRNAIFELYTAIKTSGTTSPSNKLRQTVESIVNELTGTDMNDKTDWSVIRNSEIYRSIQGGYSTIGEIAEDVQEYGWDLSDVKEVIDSLIADGKICYVNKGYGYCYVDNQSGDRVTCKTKCVVSHIGDGNRIETVITNTSDICIYYNKTAKEIGKILSNNLGAQFEIKNAVLVLRGRHTADLLDAVLMVVILNCR